MDLPSRRETTTEQVGPFAVSVSFVDGRPVEFFVTARAKTGTELEDILYEIGVTASKIMQGE